MSKKPVPKKKQAVSSTRSRHSKYAYEQRQRMSKEVALSKCDNCGAMKRAHYACEACGFYNGRPVFEVKSSTAPAAEIEA
jgi:large subunit ribosomal protein L32